MTNDVRARLADARLYLCTDGRRSHGDLAQFLDAVLGAGVDIVQLREKGLEAREELALLEIFADACRRHGRLLAVNDRADVALAAGADVLHLGQDDLPVPAARRILGPDPVIGRSSHSPAQADAAAAEPDVDYFCAGPVWTTPTKPGRPATGTGLLAHVAQQGPARPWFAIGGISLGRLDDVLAAGATRVVVVRAITEADDPGAAAAAFSRRLRLAGVSQLRGVALPAAGVPAHPAPDTEASKPEVAARQIWRLTRSSGLVGGAWQIARSVRAGSVWPCFCTGERCRAALDPGRILIPHQPGQCRRGDDHACDKRRYQRVARCYGREQPAGRAGQYGGDHGDHPGDGQEWLPQADPQSQGGQPFRGVEQVARQLGSVIDVIVAEPRDTAGVGKVLDPCLQRPVERRQPSEGQRGQENEPEHVERHAGLGGGGDEPEGNQAAGYRAKENARPAGRLRDRRRASTLQREVLGGHKRDRRWARVAISLVTLVASVSVVHRTSASDPARRPPGL
jgi:thiamine-phosphate pyrophosphorylase